MSRAAWWRAEEDRRLMEGGSWHEQLRDERSGNIQQPWGFSKKCKCFNIKVWQPLAVSSHSSFIFCTSFLLPKYILCPDLKPFYTNHLFSPENFVWKFVKKQSQPPKIKSFWLTWTLGAKIFIKTLIFRGPLMFVSERKKHQWASKNQCLAWIFLELNKF